MGTRRLVRRGRATEVREPPLSYGWLAFLLPLHFAMRDSSRPEGITGWKANLSTGRRQLQVMSDRRPSAIWRVLLAYVLPILICGPLANTSVAAGPTARARIVEQASATWVTRQGGVVRSFEVRVTRLTSETPEDNRARVEIIRGTCPSGRRDLICVSRKRITIDLMPHEFWVDPTLNLAGISTTFRGKPIRVEWRGTGPQRPPGVTPFITDHGAEGYVETIRNALPTGEVLGQAIPDQSQRAWGLLRIMNHGRISLSAGSR